MRTPGGHRPPGGRGTVGHVSPQALCQLNHHPPLLQRFFSTFPGGDSMELTNGLGAAAASSVLLRLRGALTHGFCQLAGLQLALGRVPAKKSRAPVVAAAYLRLPAPRRDRRKGVQRGHSPGI